MFGDHTLARGGRVVDDWRSYMAALCTSIRDAAYQVIHQARIYEELEGVPVPVLAVAGDEDHVYPQPISGRNIAAATGGSDETVRGAGHSAPLEQPQVVADLLVKHFSRAA